MSPPINWTSFSVTCDTIDFSFWIQKNQSLYSKHSRLSQKHNTLCGRIIKTVAWQWQSVAGYLAHCLIPSGSRNKKEAAQLSKDSLAPSERGIFCATRKSTSFISIALEAASVRICLHWNFAFASSQNSARTNLISMHFSASHAEILDNQSAEGKFQVCCRSSKSYKPHKKTTGNVFNGPFMWRTYKH